MARQELGTLYWKITGDTNDIDRSLAKTENNISGIGKSATNFGKIFQAAFVSAAVVGIGKLSKELILAASDAEETQNKFNVTFQAVADEATMAASALADGFGLSSTAAKGLLADTGDLLSGFGFTGAEALALSTQVNELAVDLASFTNFSGGAEGASAALTSGLLGEREAMKSLGIAITEADIKQLAEDKGIVGEIDRQTKAQLTLELALRQSKNAIGDFARSQNSFANQARVASANIENLKVSLGNVLLPAATAFVSRALNPLLEGLTKWIDKSYTLSQANKLVGKSLADLTEIEDINTLLAAQAIELEKLSKVESEYAEQIQDINDLAQFRIERGDNITQVTKDQAAALRAWSGPLADVRAKQEELNKKMEDGRVRLTELQEEQSAALEPLERYNEEVVDLTNSLVTLGEVEEQTTEEADKKNETYNLQAERLRALQKEYGTLEEVEKKWAEGALLREAELVNVGIGSLLNSFGDLGEAFVAGELGWDSFAKAGLNAIAAVLDALGAQLAAQAAALIGAAFFTAGASTAGLGPVLAGSAAAFTAAGVVRGVAGSFQSGGIVPGIPSAIDNQLVMARSGEEFIPEEDPRHSFNRGSTMQVSIYLDSEMIAKSTIDDYINTGRITIDARGLR